MNPPGTTGASMTISQWTEKLERLYENADAHRRPEEFWNAVMAHLSHIGEAIRRANYPELLKAAAHAFGWMCVYVGHCNRTGFKEFLLRACLSEVVGLKYPTMCGHCMRNVCACDSILMDSTQDKPARYSVLLEHGKTRHVEWREYTTASWLRTFWDVYCVRLHLQPLGTIGFHLLEEAGEEALAIRELVQLRGVLFADIEGISEGFMEHISAIPGLVETYDAIGGELKELYNVDSEKRAYRRIANNDPNPLVIRARLVRAKMNLVIELADTFSWLCGVLLKVKKTAEDQEVLSELQSFELLEAALREEYGCDTPEQDLACYACGKTVCECLFFHERSGATAVEAAE